MASSVVRVRPSCCCMAHRSRPCRGGRVTHRMALDHPDKVTHAGVLDIVPTHYLYTHSKIEFVQRYFHWFNYLRPAPGPENDLKTQAEAQKARATNEIQIEYLRTSSDPA